MFLDTQRKEKDERASKCIYEFRYEGGCSNQDTCPFSHAINDDDRNNDGMKESVAEKLSIMRNKQVKETKQDTKSTPPSQEIFSKEMAAFKKDVLQMMQTMMAGRNP